MDSVADFLPTSFVSTFYINTSFEIPKWATFKNFLNFQLGIYLSTEEILNFDIILLYVETHYSLEMADENGEISLYPDGSPMIQNIFTRLD